MKCSNSCLECSPRMPENKVLRPFISIHSGDYANILIGRDVLRLLNNPEYLTLLVNWDVPSVAIMECQPGDNMSFKVPEKLGAGSALRIFSKSFIARLSSVIGVSFSKAVRFHGVYDSEKKAVIIDFSNYKEAAEKQNLPPKGKDPNEDIER